VRYSAARNNPLLAAVKAGAGPSCSVTKGVSSVALTTLEVVGQGRCATNVGSYVMKDKAGRKLTTASTWSSGASTRVSGSSTVISSIRAYRQKNRHAGNRSIVAESWLSSA
jgi:hypothetical protein